MSPLEKYHFGGYVNHVTTSFKVTGKAELEKWEIVQRKINYLVRHDLAEYWGVENNKLEPKLWELAWEYGHAGGLGEVIHHYGEFVALVKDDEE